MRNGGSNPVNAGLRLCMGQEEPRTGRTPMRTIRNTAFALCLPLTAGAAEVNITREIESVTVETESGPAVIERI